MATATVCACPRSNPVFTSPMLATWLNLLASQCSHKHQSHMYKTTSDPTAAHPQVDGYLAGYRQRLECVIGAKVDVYQVSCTVRSRLSLLLGCMPIAVVSYCRDDGRFCVSNSIYTRHVKRHGTKYCGAQCVVFGSVWINQGSM